MDSIKIRKAGAIATFILTMAIIAAHQIEHEMVDWIAAYYEKEDIITPQAFMSKLDELTK